ncbi:MAG: methyltransferase [Halobacteriota archaeon]
MMYDISLVPDRIKQIVNYRKLYDVLKVAMDLDLYTLLRYPITANSVAQSLGTDELFVRYLLDVLCAVDLATQMRGKEDLECYQSTPLARQYLDSGSALCLGRELFDDGGMHQLLEQYIDEGPSTVPITAEYWTPEIIRQLETIALLGGVQEAVKLIDLRGRTRLLDVGGGHGLYSIFFARKYPDLHATVLDLPQVIDVARENIERYDTSDRVTALAGDYRTFESERAFDTVFMSNVSPSREELRFLLTKAHALLDEEGIVLVRSFVRDGTPSIWSQISTLERYARRGRRGFARDDLIAILAESEFSVTCVYESDGIIVLLGAT